MLTKVCLTLLLCCSGLSAQVTIVSSASFRTDQGVSPGSWASAFGTFSGITTTTAADLPIPKTLAGVKVTVDGVDAPVYFVRSDIITFLVPFSTSAGMHPVALSTPGGNFTATLRVMKAAPAIFLKDADNPPKGAIRNQDAAENSPGTPAKRGEVVSIYATGAGPLTRLPEDGAAPGDNPLAMTVSTPQVFIGGVPAQVQFSGLNPALPGVWQINVFVPDRPFISGRIPVRVFLDGVDSNEVGLFVQ